jgi:hypothetical protein
VQRPRTNTVSIWSHKNAVWSLVEARSIDLRAMLLSDTDIYPIRIWRRQVETLSTASAWCIEGLRRLLQRRFAVVVWTAPAGLAGCLFLGLAGVKHAVKSPRNAKEHLAMATDLFVAGVVGTYLASLVVR